jgi:ADP-ribose pyrophosphatase YjhB (NUDIX family)
MPPRSAGLAVLSAGRSRILLVHPTNAPWWRAWSIPKGLVEPGEDVLDAAIRETFEEVGLRVPREAIDPTPHDVPYLDKKGRTTKIVTWFACEVDPLPELVLQLEEVDRAALFAREEAEKRILARLLPVLGTLA